MKYNKNLNLKTKQKSRIRAHSNILVGLVVIGATLFGVGSSINMSVFAADTNITNVITVDSNGDGADANIGDGICADVSNNCTLRAAIEESNATAGTQTIEFNITGTPDFTNKGQSGYTIKPATALPNITNTVTIDGYSQPGAQANTAIAPNPLNGTLLIEIDGSSVGNVHGLQFIDDSDNSAVKGLVINNFGNGDGVVILADDIKVQGNYIGINPAGNTAKPNTVGVNAYTTTPNSGKNALIGGLSTADRNLISGNTAGTTGTASYPGEGWTFQGNYMGVAADGLTGIANSTVGGSGVLSIDHCDNVTVGGGQPGAINVIGSSLGHGIAPSHTNNLVVEGNYIGFGYDGTTVLGNSNSGVGGGISLEDSVNSTISNNKIGGWKKDGIYIDSDSTNAVISDNTVNDSTQSGISFSDTVGATVENNTISNSTQNGISLDGTTGVTVSANTVSNSSQSGVSLSSATDSSVKNNKVSGSNFYGVIVSGSLNSLIQNNSVYNNTPANIQVAGISALGMTTDGVTIKGNKVGIMPNGQPASANGMGIYAGGDATNVIIGGTNPGDGNLVSANNGAGIVVATLTAPAYNASLSPADVSILGNSIYDNQADNTTPFTSGLGIDLAEATDPDNPATFNFNVITDDGPNPNDSSDSDTGANDYINFPVLNSATQNGTNLKVNLDLDAAGTTDPDGNYRIELFANDTADPSGYGEGQTYLGFANITNGTNKTANITIPTGINLTGKVLSATTTAINNTTNSGFGSTSEFSLASSNIKVIAASVDNSADGSDSNSLLADTGQNSKLITGVAVLLTTTSIFVTVTKRKRLFRQN